MTDTNNIKRERENDQIEEPDPPTNPSTGRRWTPEQDEALRKSVEMYGQRNWKAIAALVPGRNHAQCLQRWNKVLRPGLVKGHWSYEEDQALERMVMSGCMAWNEVAKNIPGRTPKQCRERWKNHLDPRITRAPFTTDEDIILQNAFEQLGNRWTKIAALLPGRTEDSVKNRWKVLNPNQKTSAKPGRPKLMPGATSTATGTTNTSLTPRTPSTTTSTSYYRSDPGVDDTSVSTTIEPIPFDYTQQDMTASAAPMSMNSGGTYENGIHLGMETTQGYLHEQGVEDTSSSLQQLVPSLSKYDQEILNHFLRGRSSSMLSRSSSFLSIGSMSEISPEDLLASGEFDELFRSVSLTDSARPSLSNRGSDLTESKLLDSFSKAVGSIGSTGGKSIKEFLADYQQTEEFKSTYGPQNSYTQHEQTIYEEHIPQSQQSQSSQYSCVHDTAPQYQSSLYSGLDQSLSYDSTNLSESKMISSSTEMPTTAIDDALDPAMMQAFRMKKKSKSP